MRGREMYSETEYLDRAKELRDLAELVPAERAHEYLIRAAKAYERMAEQLSLAQ